MFGHTFQQLESDRQWADQLFSLRNAEFIGLPDVIQDPDFFGNGFVAGWNVQVEDIDRPDRTEPAASFRPFKAGR